MKHAENFNIPEARLADGNSDQPLASFQKTDRGIPDKPCAPPKPDSPSPQHPDNPDSPNPHDPHTPEPGPIIEPEDPVPSRYPDPHDLHPIRYSCLLFSFKQRHFLCRTDRRSQ